MRIPSPQLPPLTRSGSTVVAGLDKAYLGEVVFGAGGQPTYSGTGSVKQGTPVAKEGGKDYSLGKPLPPTVRTGPGKRGPISRDVMTSASTVAEQKSGKKKDGPPIGGGGTIGKPKQSLTPSLSVQDQAEMDKKTPSIVPPPIPKDARQAAFKAIEQLQGGMADGKKDSDFNTKELTAGMKVEREHTNDDKVAREIARDHLTEDPHYYCKLKKIEKSLSAIEDLLKAVAAQNRSKQNVGRSTLANYWNKRKKTELDDKEAVESPKSPQSSMPVVEKAGALSAPAMHTSNLTMSPMMSSSAGPRREAPPKVMAKPKSSVAASQPAPTTGGGFTLDDPKTGTVLETPKSDAPSDRTRSYSDIHDDEIRSGKQSLDTPAKLSRFAHDQKRISFGAEDRARRKPDAPSLASGPLQFDLSDVSSSSHAKPAAADALSALKPQQPAVSAEDGPGGVEGYADYEARQFAAREAAHPGGNYGVVPSKATGATQPGSTPSPLAMTSSGSTSAPAMSGTGGTQLPEGHRSIGPAPPPPAVDIPQMTTTTGGPGTLHPGPQPEQDGAGSGNGKGTGGGQKQMQKPRSMGSAFGEGYGLGAGLAGGMSSAAGGTAPVATLAGFAANKLDTSTWGGMRAAGTKSGGGSRSPSGVSGTSGQMQPSGLSNATRSIGETLLDEFHKSFANRVTGPALIVRTAVRSFAK